MSGKSKSGAIKLAIFGAILFVAGVVIFACSFPYGNGSSAYSARYRVELNVDKTLALDGVTELEIESSLHTEITENDGDEVTVKASGTYIRPYLFGQLNQITESNGNTMKIDFSKKWGFSIGFNISYFLNEETAKLEITVPKSYAGKINVYGRERSMKLDVQNVFSEGELTLGSGSFSGSIQTRGDLSLYTSSGSMNLERVRAGGALTAKLTSGSMELGDVTAAGSATVRVSSGGMKINSLSAEGNAQATVSSGKLQIHELNCRDLTTKTSSGAMELSGVTSTSLNATLASGGNTFLLKRAVSVNAKISSGNMKVDMPQPAGVNMKLYCKISSGWMKDYYFTNAKHDETFDAYLGNPSAADALLLNVTISSGGFTLTAI